MLSLITQKQTHQKCKHKCKLVKRFDKETFVLFLSSKYCKISKNITKMHLRYMCKSPDFTLGNEISMCKWQDHTTDLWIMAKELNNGYLFGINSTNTVQCLWQPSLWEIASYHSVKLEVAVWYFTSHQHLQYHVHWNQ